MTVEQSRSTSVHVELMTCARIPTSHGEFQLCYFRNNRDEKEHLALIHGDVFGRDDVLVRVHSECFTGDVLSSLRCDCGAQLQRSLQLVAAEPCGVIIYLRQEGRNIGLLDKLRSYNLQDAGFDTVDANLALGHQADSRDYVVAALILKNLGISSIRLLTNNPLKIEDIRNHGVTVTARIPLQEGINDENMRYLSTKVSKMRHMLDLEHSRPSPNGSSNKNRPYVTLSYAQSLDGSIAARPGEQLILSGQEALTMTHRLRANHDAILVGIETVLTDDPQLSVRLVEGRSPRPVILDGRLRFPLSARLLQRGASPLIATLPTASKARAAALSRAGAEVVLMPATAEGLIDLHALLNYLNSLGIGSLMVEGGARVITSFLAEGLVDRLVLTIAANIVAGLPALERTMLNGAARMPRLCRPTFQQVGDDIVVIGDVVAE